MLHQGTLAAEVAGEHPADLGDADVRLVDEEEAVGREEVEQGVRGLARSCAGERPAVVLDARAVADLQEHLEVVPGSRASSRCALEELALIAERLRVAPCRFLLDPLDGPLDSVLRQDEVLGRVDVHVVFFSMTEPVSGSITERVSISSPNSSIRNAISS